MQIANRKPDCITDVGCAIGEDLALDSEVTKTISAFLSSKRSPGAQQSPQLFEMLLAKVGLLENADLYFDLEKIYYERQPPEQTQNEMVSQALKRG